MRYVREGESNTIDFHELIAVAMRQVQNPAFDTSHTIHVIQRGLQSIARHLITYDKITD